MSEDKDICGDYTEMKERLNFIRDITGHEPSCWEKIRCMGMNRSFWLCRTNDGVNGAYVTAHNFDICLLCKYEDIYNMRFVIANTCIYEEGTDINILEILRKRNKDVDLWFSFQDVELTEDGVIRRTNTLTNCGTFGFLTSKSDRLMYRNRRNGFYNALQESFYRVSGVYGIKEYDGNNN